jgi:hypothetical protein
MSRLFLRNSGNDQRSCRPVEREEREEEEERDGGVR